MKNIKLAIIVIVANVAGCKPYEKSMQNEKETLALEMINAADTPEKTIAFNMAFPFSDAFGFLINVGSAALEKESKKYVSDYSSFSSIDDFYDEKKLKYKGFKFTREVEVKGSMVPAMTMKVGFVKAKDETALRMKIESFTLNYSRCKVWKGKKEKAIDLVVKISVETAWTDKQGPHTMTLANDEFSLTNVEFDKSYTPTDAIGKWMPNVPVSDGATGDFTGNLTIKLTIVETDDFGEHLVEISKFLAGNKDDLKGIVETLTKKE